MTRTPGSANLLLRWARSHPVPAYFALTFAISWTGAFLLVAPRLLRGESIPKFTGLMMFPIMLLGPLLAGIALTALTAGREGFVCLGARMRRIRVPAPWFLVLSIPPVLMLAVLVLLATFVSPVYAPNRFLIGIAFGLVAGFIEEIGWTGFALPAMMRTRTPFAGALLLGLLWSLWHAPVIDDLGTATPHGSYWLAYFLAFAAAMTAMRILIAFLFANTDSVLLAQLLHAASTGSLVVFSPARVSAAQEAFWYAAYAAALWIVVLLLRAILGPRLEAR
ncbi:MAG: type II CAAX prenyl endopeptidase Rce1 family protein [Acidobacteriota bacterium]